MYHSVSVLSSRKFQSIANQSNSCNVQVSDYFLHCLWTAVSSLKTSIQVKTTQERENNHFMPLCGFLWFFRYSAKMANVKLPADSMLKVPFRLQVTSCRAKVEDWSDNQVTSYCSKLVILKKCFLNGSRFAQFLSLTTFSKILSFPTFFSFESEMLDALFNFSMLMNFSDECGTSMVYRFKCFIARLKAIASNEDLNLSTARILFTKRRKLNVSSR